MAPTFVDVDEKSWNLTNVLYTYFRKMRKTYTHARSGLQKVVEYPNKKRGITFMTPPLILVAYHLSGGFQFSQGDL